VTRAAPAAAGPDNGIASDVAAGWAAVSAASSPASAAANPVMRREAGVSAAVAREFRYST